MKVKLILSNTDRKRLVAQMADQLIQEVKLKMWNAVEVEVKRQLATERLNYRVKKEVIRLVNEQLAGNREMLDRIEKLRPFFVKLALMFPELAPELNIAIDGFPELLKKEREKKGLNTSDNPITDEEGRKKGV